MRSVHSKPVELKVDISDLEAQLKTVKPAKQYYKWDDKKIAFLKKYYGKYSSKDIAKILQTSKDIILKKANELELRFYQNINN